MQILELQFNPKEQKDVVFDSFCYEPSNVYEKNLGSLYLVGKLNNIIPKNEKLLNKIALAAKEKYYSEFHKAPLRKFKETLEEINNILAREVEKENVSWMGNLNLAVLSIKNKRLNFSKIGNIEIILSRRGVITDLGAELKEEEMNPYPLKLFSNIVSGNLAKNDKIMIFTKEIYEFFKEKNLLEKTAKTENKEEIDKLIKEKKKELSSIAGTLLLISLNNLEEGKKVLTFGEEPVSFPFLKKIKIPRINLKLKKFKMPSLPRPKNFFIIPILSKIKIHFVSLLKNKKIILTTGLLIILLLSWALGQQERKNILRKHEEILESSRKEMIMGKNYILLGNEEEANNIFKNAWGKISLAIKEGSPIIEELKKEKKLVEEELYKLNKIEDIKTFKPFYKFTPEDFIQRKIIFLDKKIYTYNPENNKIIIFSENGKKEKEIKINGKIGGASVISKRNLALFSQPGKLIILKDGEIKKIVQLKTEERKLDLFNSYKGNLYFFDRNSETIIKYNEAGELQWSSPATWLVKNEKLGNITSMAVNNSIFLLKDNEIQEFFGGHFKKVFRLDIFPEKKELKKIISPSFSPFLFILEPAQERIIILDKHGRLIKQIKSKKLRDTLDFTLSETGKKVYLLQPGEILEIEVQLF